MSKKPATMSHTSQWNPRRSRGARLHATRVDRWHSVSVEPPPKQGCEIINWVMGDGENESQWNPRRSRGASTTSETSHRDRCCLSGTPAEAGVRAPLVKRLTEIAAVSVEPPPKQGCEFSLLDQVSLTPRLSGTPAEAGVRVDMIGIAADVKLSQWNPRRSRGARSVTSRDWGSPMSLSGTPAEAGVRVVTSLG